MKSYSSLILNEVTSGVHINTFGFPPNLGSFASKSPKALDTETLPGKTLIGPNTLVILPNLLLDI